MILNRSELMELLGIHYGPHSMAFYQRYEAWAECIYHNENKRIDAQFVREMTVAIHRARIGKGAKG